MNDVLLILVGLATLLLGGLAAYYRRLASTEESRRQQLRDSLELIDTRSRLRALQTDLDQLEKERIDAKADYDKLNHPTDSK